MRASLLGNFEGLNNSSKELIKNLGVNKSQRFYYMAGASRLDVKRTGEKTIELSFPWHGGSAKEFTFNFNYKF